MIRYVPTSSSRCALLSSSRRAGWLLRRVSMRRPLVISLSRRAALSSSRRASWLPYHLLSSYLVGIDVVGTPDLGLGGVHAGGVASRREEVHLRHTRARSPPPRSRYRQRRPAFRRRSVTIAHSVAVASPSCHQSPSPSRCPSPSSPLHHRRAFNRRRRRPVHRRCRRAVRRRRRHRVAIMPFIVFAARLPSPSSPSRCRCTVHRRPSPSLLRCRRAVASPSSPLPSLSLSPPPPPPAFADPFIGWLLRCCPPSAFVIPCRHATVDDLVAGRFCR